MVGSGGTEDQTHTVGRWAPGDSVKDFIWKRGLVLQNMFENHYLYHSASLEKFKYFFKEYNPSKMQTFFLNLSTIKVCGLFFFCFFSCS